jgi:hypothetical protein
VESLFLNSRTLFVGDKELDDIVIEEVTLNPVITEPLGLFTPASRKKEIEEIVVAWPYWLFGL